MLLRRPSRKPGYCREFPARARYTVPALWLGAYLAALSLLILNRLADGIDASLARRLGPTDLSAYLDIVLHFIVYSAVVFGFCLRQPEAAVVGAFLIFSFIRSGPSFLAFAILAHKHGITTEAQGQKSIYFLSGIAEGFETIVVLSLMCLIPEYFSTLAVVFGAICWLSTAGRIAQAARTFR